MTQESCAMHADILLDWVMEALAGKRVGEQYEIIFHPHAEISLAWMSAPLTASADVLIPNIRAWLDEGQSPDRQAALEALVKLGTPRIWVFPGGMVLTLEESLPLRVLGIRQRREMADVLLNPCEHASTRRTLLQEATRLQPGEKSVVLLGEGASGHEVLDLRMRVPHASSLLEEFDGFQPLFLHRLGSIAALTTSGRVILTIEVPEPEAA